MGGGINFGHTGGGAEQFDFGPKEDHVTLSFQQAAMGVTKDMYVSVMDTCGSCNGSGSEKGSKPERCPSCNGTGMETVSTGPFMMRSTCRRCQGKGTWNKNPCSQCNGHGQANHRKKVSVPVPAGIEDGQTVRMPVGKVITSRGRVQMYTQKLTSPWHRPPLVERYEFKGYMKISTCKYHQALHRIQE